MTIEKVNQSSWRVRKQYNGKRFCLTFDHKPTQKEVNEEIMKRCMDGSDYSGKGTFQACAESYIAAKSNVLSSSTIKGYDSYLRNMPESFKRLKMTEIDGHTIQLLINDYASTHSPKYTKNVSGFVLAVFSHFNPNKHISITLPQKKTEKDYMPTSEDVKRVFEDVKGTNFEIPLLLAGCCGLRRSEICALEDGDLKGNVLTISKAKVQDKDNNWIIKQTKTEAGTRSVTLPDYLVGLINERGFYQGHPNQIVLHLYKVQRRLGIPRFSLHKLRHFFASYSHTIGIPDKYIMEAGGWKCKSVLDSIYQHALSDKSKDMQKQIADSVSANLLI